MVCTIMLTYSLTYENLFFIYYQSTVSFQTNIINERIIITILVKVKSIRSAQGIIVIDVRDMSSSQYQKGLYNLVYIFEF